MSVITLKGLLPTTYWRINIDFGSFCLHRAWLFQLWRFCPTWKQSMAHGRAIQLRQSFIPQLPLNWLITSQIDIFIALFATKEAKLYSELLGIKDSLPAVRHGLMDSALGSEDWGCGFESRLRRSCSRGVFLLLLPPCEFSLCNWLGFLNHKVTCSGRE